MSKIHIKKAKKCKNYAGKNNQKIKSQFHNFFYKIFERYRKFIEFANETLEIKINYLLVLPNVRLIDDQHLIMPINRNRSTKTDQPKPINIDVPKTQNLKKIL